MPNKAALCGQVLTPDLLSEQSGVHIGQSAIAADIRLPGQECSGSAGRL